MTVTPPLSKEPLHFHFPDVQEAQLDDGTPIYAIYNPDEDISTCGIYINTGSAHDATSGATAFAAEMLARGTMQYSAHEFDDTVEGLGSTVRSSCDRDTSTVHAISLNEHFEKTVRLAAQCLTTPAFGNIEMETMRQQFITDAQIDAKDPDWLATQASNHVCYAGHPYERRRRGTTSDILAITREHLTEAHQRIIRSPRRIVIAGAVHIDTALKIFNDALKGLPTPSFDPTLQRAAITRKTGCIAANPEAVQSSFRISMPCTVFDDPDYPALKLVTATLGGYTLARLFAVLREQKGYTYGAYAHNSVRPYASTTDLVTSVGNAFTADTLQTIVDEVKRIATEQIPINELENTRQYILGTFARTNETPQQTAGLLWTTLLYGLPRDYYSKHIERLAQLTPEELLPVQKKYFDVDTWAVGASGLPDILMPALEPHVNRTEILTITE